MTMTTIKLSSKGQIVIPSDIRKVLHWETGTELTLIANSDGISLKALPAQSGRDLTDLIGLLKHDGAPVSTDELCKAVDARLDWERSGRRSKCLPRFGKLFSVHPSTETK